MFDRKTISIPASMLVLLLLSCSFQLITVSRTEAAQNQQAAYVCPMHSDVKSAKPAKCPKCGHGFGSRHQAQ